jgi:arginyl-tRNA synthetase
VKLELENTIKALCKSLMDVEIDINLTRPSPEFGDYSTSVALQLAKLTGKSPRDVASEIKENIKHSSVREIKVEGPGFINIFLTDEALADASNEATNLDRYNSDKQIIVEFGDPNPFKEMHIGHLYDAVIGDSIAQLLESSGADTKRLSYHGDVGLQVAKWVWGIGSSIDWDPNKIDQSLDAPADESLGRYYALGAKAYEDDEKIAAEIKSINQHVYSRDDPIINELYDKGRTLSIKLFDETFAKLDISSDKRYFESETSKIGLEFVKKYTGTVFEESEGAVVYKGEKQGLHTRVFVNSQGLPTYEAKDLGLAELKNLDFPNADLSIYVTANEQSEYFKVMFAALGEIDPELAKKTKHISHGFLSLSSGKMSSRSGDIYSAEALISDVNKAVTKKYPESSEISQDIAKSALRYAFLKQRIGPDVIFDIEESVGLEGNSGPYLQYAHARACSILAKTKVTVDHVKVQGPLNPEERSLTLKISEYPEAVELATREYLPSHLCTYLYELAQVFNRFYEKNRVIGDEREGERIALVDNYSKVLKSGLGLLKITALEHM